MLLDTRSSHPEVVGNGLSRSPAVFDARVEEARQAFLHSHHFRGMAAGSIDAEVDDALHMIVVDISKKTLDRTW